MTECERCGFPLGPKEGRWRDGDYICPLCVEEVEFREPDAPAAPPHVTHWGYEGERRVANGTR